MAALTLALTFILAAAPRFTPTVPLGVRVPHAQLSAAAVTSALRSYRTIVWSVGIAATVLTVVLWEYPVLASLTSMLVVAGSLVAYVIERHTILKAKAEGGWFEGVDTVIAGSVTSEPRLSFPWAGIAASLFLTAAGALIVVARWDEIPDVVATHWNGANEPDAWADKSVGSVFLLSFVALGMVVTYALVSLLIRSSFVHVRSDRTPAGQVRTHAILAASIDGTGILFVLLNAAFAVAQVVTVLPRYADYTWVGFTSIMAASVLGIIGMLVVFINAQKDMPAAEAESPDNDHLYKAGMFYYNPDDPAVLVERRFGVGVDFNYARWQAKAFVAAIALLIIGSIALPLLVSQQ